MGDIKVEKDLDKAYVFLGFQVSSDTVRDVIIQQFIVVDVAEIGNFSIFFTTCKVGDGGLNSPIQDSNIESDYTYRVQPNP